MTVILTYAAVALLAVSILLSRVARRQMDAARKALAAEEMALSAAGLALQEAMRAQHDAEQRHGGLDGRLEQAQSEVRTAQQVLAATKQAPVERLHVFDRLEPRPGALWSVTVIRHPEAPGPAAWTGERNILIAAAGQTEAMERVALRHPRAAGFEVRSATPCPLFPGVEQPVPRPRKRRPD